MDVNTDQTERHQNSVPGKESVIERVADRSAGYHRDEGEGYGSDHAPLEAYAGRDADVHLIEAARLEIVDAPSKAVQNRLEHHDAGRPSVEEIEYFVGDPEHGDKGVVSEGEKNRWDKVERGELPCATAQLGYQLRLVLTCSSREPDSRRCCWRDTRLGGRCGIARAAFPHRWHGKAGTRDCVGPCPKGRRECAF